MKVIFYQGEHNGYDDSDFYYVGVDTETGMLFKHIYGSTRWAGSQPLEDSIDFSEMIESEGEKAKEQFQNAIKNLVDADKTILEGDTVIVSNPRARNHKGETFIIHSVKEIYWNSQLQQYSAMNSDKSIQVNIKNLSLVKRSEKNFEALASAIRHGRGNIYRLYGQ